MAVPTGLGLIGTAFFAAWLRRHTVWFNAEERARLEAYKCPGCLGYGEQILLPDPWVPEKKNGRPNLVWQPIPVPMRVIQKNIHTDPSMSSAPHGNRRDCPHCHGIGHYWDTEL